MLAVWGAGETKQRDIVEILQVDSRIRLGQKLQLHPDLYTDVGAMRHERLQSRQLLHVDGKYNLVDDPVLQYLLHLTRWKNLVVAEAVGKLRALAVGVHESN